MKRNNIVFAIIVAAVTLFFTPVFCLAEAWTVQDVTGSFIPFNKYYDDCIATDSAGAVYVISVDDDYFNTNSDDLYISWFDNEKWHSEEVPYTTERVDDPYILIDNSDIIHIFYVTYNDYYTGIWKIVHIYGQPGQWSHQHLISGELPNIHQIEATIDNNDKLHISFASCDSGIGIHIVYYLTNVSGSWQYEQVVADTETLSSKIAILPDGTVYIAAKTLNVFDNLQIECFSKQAEIWQGQPLPFTNLDNLFSEISLAADSSGNLHSSTLTTTGGHYNLAYATNASGAWLCDIIESAPEPDYVYTSSELLTDSNDYVHLICIYTDANGISYYSRSISSTASFKYLKGNYGSWQSETIYISEPNNKVSLDWTFASDQQDNLYIAGTLDYPKSLDMFKGRWGDWTNQTAVYNGKTGNRSLLMLDSSDQPKIAYQDTYNGNIYWSQTDGTCWADINDAFDVSVSGPHDWDVCLDSGDNRYLAYVQQNERYYCSTDANGLWETQTFQLSGGWGDVVFSYRPSIAALSPQDIHLGIFKQCRREYMGTYGDYYVSSCSDRTNTNGVWEDLFIDYGDPGLNVFQNMGIDSTGMFHNAYIWGDTYWLTIMPIGQKYDLKYARLHQGLWLTEIVDPNVAIYNGYTSKPDIAFADTGNAAHISYYHDDEYAVKYATNASGSWVLDTIPTSGLLSKDTAITIDSSGLPHIALVEDEVLKIARYTNSSCTQWEFNTIEQSVDSENPMPSLAVDSNDEYHISFYKEAEKKILYATTSIDSPVISVEPDTINFYKPKDFSGDADLTIRNNGSATLHISNMSFAGSDAGKFSHGGYSSSIPGGGICLTTVTVDTSQTGSFDAELKIQSDDPRNPILTIPLHAFVFDLSPSYLECKISLVDFNEVELGQTSDMRTLRFTNTYSGSLTIYDMGVGLVDPNNFPTNRFSFPFSLAEDGYMDVKVSFEPQELGQIDGILTIAIDMGDAAEVALTGKGIAQREPNLAVNADSFELEAMLPDGSDKTYISIENAGDANLEISQWDVNNVTEFTTDPNKGFNPLSTTMPVVLAPGEKRSMMMTFSTAVPGNYTNVLDITSNDPDSKHTIITFTGNAVRWNKCDFDIDGDVDFVDFATLAKDWMVKPDINPYPGDIVPEEPDGVVNMLDLEYFVNQWLLTKDFF